MRTILGKPLQFVVAVGAFATAAVAGDDTVKSCPSGWADTGAACTKPAPYGRGSGYKWQHGDPNSDAGMYQRCEADHGKGNCEKNGAIVYPKCKAGYHNVGCCICSPGCPSGYRDAGTTCIKPT